MTLPQPITSRSNARVKALRAAFSGKVSKPGEPVGLEGETLLLEALRSGLQVNTLFLREGSEAVVPRVPGLSAIPIVVLSADVFASAVETNSPQGVAAIVTIPEVAKGGFEEGPGVTLVLESMQDPGNLGTLIRAAEAFGAAQVLITADTANPWNAKAVRASAGSVFRVPVKRVALEEVKEWASARRVRLYAAVAQEEGAVACTDAELARICALMIGNEGAGLSEAALALADARIHIPCATESLNAAVAGATLLYEAMRQRMAAEVTSSGGVRR